MEFAHEAVIKAAAAWRRLHGLVNRSPNVLATAATGRHNNLDLLRLLFALIVLLGHSFAINPMPGYVVPGSAFLLSTWIGTVGVAGFFAMSGFLVTASALTHGILNYFQRRALRIYPGLIMCLAITVVVFSFHSSLPLASYFGHNDTRQFFLSNVTLTKQAGTLPGVFENTDSPVGSSINGSLWTLPLEARLYVFLGSLAFFGALKNRLTATITIFTLVIIGYYSFDDLPLMPPASNWGSTSIYFVIGAIFYIHRESVVLEGRVALLCCGIFLWAQGKSYFPLVATVPYVYALLYLGFRTPVIPIASWIGDLSYGIYIYAWPVQRLITYHVHGLNPWMHAALSTIVTGTFAYFSWHFIEKPALRWKSRHLRRQSAKADQPAHRSADKMDRSKFLGCFQNRDKLLKNRANTSKK